VVNLALGLVSVQVIHSSTIPLTKVHRRQGFIRPANVLRFSCRRGARRKLSKKARSRAPKAVSWTACSAAGRGSARLCQNRHLGVEVN